MIGWSRVVALLCRVVSFLTGTSAAVNTIGPHTRAPDTTFVAVQAIIKGLPEEPEATLGGVKECMTARSYSKR